MFNDVRIEDILENNRKLKECDNHNFSIEKEHGAMSIIKHWECENCHCTVTQEMKEIYELGKKHAIPHGVTAAMDRSKSALFLSAALDMNGKEMEFDLNHINNIEESTYGLAVDVNKKSGKLRIRKIDNPTPENIKKAFSE